LSDRKIGSMNTIRPVLRSLNPGALTQLKSEVFTEVRYNWTLERVVENWLFDF
jgi:hypothetical protein